MDLSGDRLGSQAEDPSLDPHPAPLGFLMTSADYRFNYHLLNYDFKQAVCHKIQAVTRTV